jgi:hypothetical protein
MMALVNIVVEIAGLMALLFFRKRPSEFLAVISVLSFKLRA